MLEQNARNQSSLGTGSKFDIGEEETIKAWKQYEEDIKEIDAFQQFLPPYLDKNFL